MLTGLRSRNCRTVVGPEVELHGDLTSRGLVEVHGKLEGNLWVAGKVLICEEAVCNSNIVADSVEIAGQVHGDVRAEKLVLCRTGRLYGQSACRRQIIRKGGAIVSAGSGSIQEAPGLADPTACAAALMTELQVDVSAAVPAQPARPVQHVQPVRPRRQSFTASF
ncbi:MAG: bactofilin family protein [Ignavibacteriales bacterium]